MSSLEDQNRRDFADVMDFFGGAPSRGPRPVDSRPFYSGPSVPSGPYDDLIRDTAGRYGIREDVARAMAYAESGFNPRAIGEPIEGSGDRAKGLYQFRDQTAAEEKIDPFDPAQATDAAMKRLRRHLDRFGGRYDLAVAAHIMGPEGAAQSGGRFSPLVSDYVARITGAPRSRMPSDFEEVMSFMAGPPSTPKPTEPTPPETPPPAVVEPEPGPPLALPPLQRATPQNLPDLMAMPKDARERYMAARGTPVRPMEAEPTPGEKAKQAGVSALRVLPEFAASAGEMLGILGAAIDNFAMTAMRPGGPVFVKPDISGKMPTDTSFQGEVARALKDNPNLKPEDVATYKIGQIVRDWTEQNLPNDERLRNSFLYTVLPQAVSSTLLFWGVGAAAGGSRLAIMATGATFAAPQAYREAIAAGADPDTATKAAFENILWGSTEVLGLEAVLGNHGVPKTAIGYITRAIVSGLDEGGQEFGQQLLQNWTAQRLYDPQRGWNDGAVQATGAGGIVGILMSSIQGASQAMRARRATTTAPMVQAAPDLAPPTPGPTLAPEEPVAPAQREIAQANQAFARERLSKLVDEAERTGQRIDTGVAGPNDAANMARIMQEIQRLSAEFGIAPTEISRQPAAPAPAARAPAPPAQPVATERQLAVEQIRTWKPWISEGEIQAQDSVEGLDRLVEVAKARREAAREKRILDMATPEERATYARPGAPQKLILRAIEDRLAKAPPTRQTAPTVTEEDIQAVVSKPSEVAPFRAEVPSETTYRGAAERLRQRLGAPAVERATATTPAVQPVPSGPVAAPAPVERRATTARELDMTKVRPEVAAFADRYVKRAGQKGFAEVDQLAPLNRDEERLVADAVDRAAARRPPAPGQNVFLTQEEQEYVKRFREAKGRGEPPPEAPTPKGPTAARKGREQRLATMEGKLGHWWSVILEQGPISRDSLQRTYVGEDPSKPGYKESLATFNEIVAGLNKKWGAGMVVKNEGGMRLDEAAQMAAEKGFAGGDPIEARNRILQMIDELSGRKPAKVSGRRKGFGNLDPELASMTKDVAAGDLREGESFTTGDGNYWTVARKAPGEITLSSGPEAQGGQTLKLDEFDVVPIVGRAGPRGYVATGAPREMAQAARTGDPFQDADAELKELLFTTSTYQVARGATTQERLQTALTKEFGPNVEQYVPGLWRLLTRLPGMRRFISPPEVPRGPKPGGGLPIEQRPAGAAPGGRLQPAAGPGDREPAGGLRPSPAAPTPGTTVAAAPTATSAEAARQVAPTIDRTQTDRGVATVSRELLPELTGPGKALHAEYSTPERLAEMTQKFGGKRPMRHQIEQAARAVMAFAKGHAYINGDGTGTGKTLTTGLVIDSILRKKPEARTMIVVRNPGIMKQWHADVLGPMGLKVHEVKATFRAEKAVINFVTYTRLQILETANALGLVEGYHPDLLVFDESHALKNWYTGETKLARAGETITGKNYSDNVLFLSATPFESILHTGYLTRSGLWTNWTKWLEDTMQIRFSPEKERWEGLTPAKVKRMHEALVRQGRMGKNEIDFADLKSSAGQSITLRSENVLVPLTEENAKAYASMNAVFDGYLEDALMDNDRAKLRMLRGIQHFFRRSYDEAHKLPAAIERAHKDVANGKTVLFFLLRKNDSSVEKWWNRYEEDPDRYPAGSRMPQLLEALKAVQPPIAVPSPVRLIQDAFPEAVKITGDEEAGGTQREKNIQAIMKGDAKVGIITIAAGAEALNLQDKMGTHPRVSYILSTPYTASTAKQVMGRGFRLGSESSAEILWLFNDTPSDRRVATNMAWLSRMMGAAVAGEVENPNADELERFMFPELDRNGSNGGTAREMAGDEVEPQVVIGWMTRERRRLQGEVEQIRRRPDWPDRMEEIRQIEEDMKMMDGVVSELRRQILKAVQRPVSIEASDRLILESPPEPKSGQPSQKEMFADRPQLVTQKELLRQRLLAIERRMIQGKTEPIQWTDDTLFGAEEKKDIERRQRRLATEEPKPREMVGQPRELRVPGRPTKPSGRPWLWTVWEKLGVAEKARIKSRNQMLNDYLRNIGLKSFIGRMGLIGRNVRARYWPGAQYARRRTAQDIQAAVHESGHYLDEILFGLDPSGDLGSVSNAEMRRFRGELLPLATPSQGRDPFPEGLAEFVRLYIMENEKAQRVAPRFYPWFEERMRADPRTDQVLAHMETLRQDHEAFGAADWKEQFGSMFRTTYGVTGRVGRAMPFRRIHRALYWSATMTTWLENKATRAMGIKPEQLPMEWRPSKVFGALPGRWQIIEHWLEHGPTSPERPGLEPTMPGLLKIADLIHNKWRDFEMYTTAMRAQHLRDARGENVEETIGLKNEWVDRAVTEFGKNPTFRRTAALLQKYRSALLDYMEWGGLIDANAKATFMKNEPDYRPLLRLMDEDLIGRPGHEAGGARVAGLSSGLYRRKGSTRDIMPIFEAYQRMTFLTIDRAERNMAAQSLVRLAKRMPGGGELIHRVPMQEWPVTFKLDRVKQKLLQAGLDPKAVDDALAEHHLTVYLPSWMQPRAPYDWVWANGKRELYYFDPDLYRVVEGMDRIHRDIVHKTLAPFARMHRGGIAVYDPTFWLWQVFPQILSTGVQTGSLPRLAAELPASLPQMLTEGKVAQKYQRAFTGMSTYMRLDPRALGRLMGLKMLRATGEAPGWWANPMNLARYFMAYSSKVGMALEHAPRLAEAKVAGLREATTRSEMMRVGERARESDIDFSRQGMLTGWLTGISSFFAPYMIGQERLAKEIRNHPVRLAFRLNLVLTPLALAVWAWNRRDDENEKQWRQTPRYVKDNNWIVQHPDPTKEPFQFRLPQQYGWFVGAIWATLDKLADKDPETYQALARDIVQDLNPVPRGVPNAFRSELEIWANQNLYTGRPVYPEGRLPEYTYWPWTTQSAIDLGRAMKVPPAIVQHEMRGKLGTLGEQMLRVADVARGVETPGQVPAHATPFLGRFRGAYPRASGEYVNRFYDLYKQAELVYRTGRLPELLMKGETGPLFKDRSDAIRIYTSGRGLAAALAGYNRILTIIEANPTMTAEEKRAKQEDIYRQKNEMAERWWRATMKLPTPDTARGMIGRLLSPGSEQESRQ
jgi:conjugative element/phage-associated large polyvalent protein/transglycosylase-like protein with SLT domain/type III restriction/modification enzyme restriction subunit